MWYSTRNGEFYRQMAKQVKTNPEWFLCELIGHIRETPLRTYRQNKLDYEMVMKTLQLYYDEHGVSLYPYVRSVLRTSTFFHTYHAKLRSKYLRKYPLFHD